MKAIISRPIATKITLTRNGQTTATVSRTVSRSTVAASGIQGPKGDDGISAGPAFVHTQSVASSSWTVFHNLGRHPGVMVEIGSEIVEARVSFPNDSSALIEFKSPQVGKTYCF